MKYNLKSIMKKAWEIKKENKKNIFSICLKMAWEEVKNTKIEIVKEKEVFYGDYKRKYYDCQTVKDSYNKETKNITIKVPYFFITVKEVCGRKEYSRLSKELTKEFGIDNAYDYARVAWSKTDDGKNVLICPVKIIDDVVENLGNKVNAIIPVSNDLIEIV